MLPKAPKAMVPLLTIEAPAILPTLSVLAAVAVNVPPALTVTVVNSVVLTSRVSVVPLAMVAVYPAIGIPKLQLVQVEGLLQLPLAMEVQLMTGLNETIAAAQAL